jgi:hypothetical protein
MVAVGSRATVAAAVEQRQGGAGRRGGDVGHRPDTTVELQIGRSRRMLVSMPRNPGSGHLHTHQHSVQFYSDAKELFKTIATFLGEGLVAGQPAIVIATREHVEQIEAALKKKFIDVTEARRLGDLVLLDADEALSTFMVGGLPDPGLFRRNIGTIIQQTIRGRENTLVRAYGEMVDVLWQKGKADAALQLEALWNELAEHYSFSLLCGYAMANVEEQSEGFRDICRQHAHVVVPA